MSSPTSFATPHVAWKRPAAFAGIAMASFLGCIDFTIVNTAIPAIQADFGVGLGAVQWVVTAFIMALSSCTIAVGQLADRHGHQRALLASMLVFGAASLGAGWAADLHALVAWRLLQGVACAGLYTASAALVGQMFPAAQRGRALGLLLSANGLGLALGPVVGGVLVDTWGWRWIFWLNVPLILASIALCASCLPRATVPPARGRFDWWGAVLLLCVLPCWIAVAIHGAEWGWTAARTTGLWLLGSVLALALAWIERRAAVPLLRWHWFAQPRFVVAAVATAALAFFYCAAFFMMPLYLAVLRHQSAMTSGWLLLPTTVLMALVSPLAGRWADRWGTGRVMALGFAALLLSAVMQATLTASTDWWWVLAAFACMGLGWGGVLSPSMSAAMSAFAPEQAGNAIGMATTVHNLGGVLGLAAATVVLQWASGGAGQAAATAAGGDFIAGYQAVMLVLAAVCVLAMWVLLASLRRTSAARADQV